MERISFNDIPKGMFEKLRDLETFIENSGINRKIEFLIKLRVSQINGCAYCVDMHYKELKHLKETELRLYSLNVWRDTHYFSDLERAVLDYAEELTNIKNTPLNEAIYTKLLDFYTREEICFISLIITQINTWNRLMKSFGFTPGNYEVQNL